MNVRTILLTTAFPFLALAAGAITTHENGPTKDEKFSWPQWRGPARDGISRETNWVSEGAEEHLWETEVGLGYSTVSIQDGRLYTMGFDEEAKLDVVWCLEAETGEEIWTYAFPAKIWNQAHRGGTVNTPVIDGKVVYVLNREGNFFCLDAKTGDEIWHHELKEEHDLTYPTWGFSASPLILGDELILNVGKVFSVSKKDGEVLWASKDYGHAYSTPAAFDLNGKPSLAVFNNNGVAVIDREAGEEIYFKEWGGGRGVNAATPIVINDAVFISSSRGGGGALLAFGESELEPVWESKSMRSQLSGCVLMNEALYGFDLRILKCIDLEGNVLWSERGIGNGAVMGSPGRLILMGGTGELIIAEATSEEYRELSRTKLFDKGVYWSKPVLANGLIYCRSNEGGLICRDHRGES